MLTGELTRPWGRVSLGGKDMGSLADVTGRLKRAAIDAWMAENTYTQLEDKYLTSYGPAEQYEVNRPGESGPYICTVTSSPIWGLSSSEKPTDTEARIDGIRARLQQGWDTICTSIDDAVLDWEELPEASSMDSVVDASNDIIAELGGATMNDATVLTVGGGLASAMSRVDAESVGIASPAINDFKVRYIDEGRPRALRLTALTEVLEQAARAEQNVLLEAKKDLNARLEGHVEAFESLSGRGDGDPKATFAVVGAAISILTTLLPSGGMSAIAASGAGIIVGLAEKLTPPPEAAEKSISFSDVEAGLASLSSSLSDLSLALYREETSIRTALNETADSVRANSSAFMLTPAPIYHVLPASDVDINLAAGYALARRYMPEAAGYARGQADPVIHLGTSFAEATARPYAVGSSSTGPGNAVIALTILTSTLLREFVHDFESGARNLELAIQDYESFEASTAAELQAIADQIASGVTHNGKQNETLITPSYGSGGVTLRELMEG